MLERAVQADWEQAVLAGDIARVSELLDHGADIDARDQHGQTAIMLAAHRGHQAMTDLLASRGAALDVTAKYGLSALMLAIVAGHEAVARRLAESGATLTIVGTGTPGFAGKTAYDLAVERGLMDLASQLRAD